MLQEVILATVYTIIGSFHVNINASKIVWFFLLVFVGAKFTKKRDYCTEMDSLI